MDTSTDSWDTVRLFQQFRDTGVYLTTSAGSTAWTTINSNHNSGTAIDIQTPSGLLAQIEAEANPVTYQPMTYRDLDKFIKKYPYTPEEATEKQEEKSFSFFESLTTTKK